MQERHPLAVEDALLATVGAALDAEDLVVVDDLHLLRDVVNGCRAYPRSGLIELVTSILSERAAAEGKCIVVGTHGYVTRSLHARGLTVSIAEFEPADYAFLCAEHLGSEAASLVDAHKLHRFAPRLNGYQIRDACRHLARRGSVDTDRFIAYLRDRHLTSNVALGEVARVELADLIGIDDVIESLEANVVLPLENDALASELALRPKRGVLLSGPPGTGKTTVGRALAHRLRGKFFLVDGTFISGTPHFYAMVDRIFREAKANAPSVIFVDDSDVIFESGDQHGLYRYLLTMLDGLESKSSGRVCVILTAMDVGNLPPALIRSGRVELWLEMRLPDAEARSSLLARAMAGIPAALAGVDLVETAAATDGFTGADLKRVVEDGKVLYAHDLARGRTLRAPTQYSLTAAAAVAANRERYAKAARSAQSVRPQRPPWFNVAYPTYVIEE